jgi:nucleoside-diphosphate-sugar epimerase
VERALVTGVTGFIGSHLAPALAAQGVEVHALVRPSVDSDRLAVVREHLTVHTVEPNIDSVHAAVVAAAPDVCFHLATHFVAQHALDEIDALAEANIVFPMRVAESLADSGVARFVNVGSAWQHVESAPYRPKGLYAATKQAFDDVLAAYTWSSRLAVVSLRFFDTYGPNDPRGKVVDALVRAAVRGEPIDMGSGEQLIDLVHVDDAVAALIVAADAPVDAGAPARFAVSSGRPVRLRELAELVAQASGRALNARWGAREDRPDEMMTPWDAGPPLPGWSPKISLEDGLCALVDAST